MKIHLRRAADGAYFPACCVSYLRPDPKKALLPTTEDVYKRQGPEGSPAHHLDWPGVCTAHL